MDKTLTATTYAEFCNAAADMARLNGWSAPNGLFIGGDLKRFWKAAKRQNAADPIAAMRVFPCWSVKAS